MASEASRAKRSKIIAVYPKLKKLDINKVKLPREYPFKPESDEVRDAYKNYISLETLSANFDINSDLLANKDDIEIEGKKVSLSLVKAQV